MSDKPFSQITQPFADGEYNFALTWDGAIEWEEKTSRSLYGTFKFMAEHQSGMVADVREIIRIALVGGGLAPIRALSLVKRYVEGRPLDESLPVALSAIEAFLFGPVDKSGDTAKTGEVPADG